MKIAILSDIHDNFHNLEEALKIIKERGIKKALFWGDFINNGIAKNLVNSGLDIFAVWGNNDGDKVVITKTFLSSGGQAEIADKICAEIEIDGKNFSFSLSGYCGNCREK